MNPKKIINQPCIISSNIIKTHQDWHVRKVKFLHENLIGSQNSFFFSIHPSIKDEIFFCINKRKREREKKTSFENQHVDDEKTDNSIPCWLCSLLSSLVYLSFFFFAVERVHWILSEELLWILHNFEDSDFKRFWCSNALQKIAKLWKYHDDSTSSLSTKLHHVKEGNRKTKSCKHWKMLRLSF